MPTCAQSWGLAVVGGLLLSGCQGSVTGDDTGMPPSGPAMMGPRGGAGGMTPPPPTTTTPTSPTTTPAAMTPVLKRLTASQFRASVATLLGDGITLPELPEDDRQDRFRSIAAARGTLGTRDLETYLTAAYAAAAQTFRDERRRTALVGCTPAGVEDTTCAQRFFTAWLPRAFRRPVAADEIAAYVKGAQTSARRFSDGWRGLEEAVAAALIAPSHLMRLEEVEVDPTAAGKARFVGTAMASRLSFLFLDAPPSDALLAAAGRGELSDAAGVRRAAGELIKDPRAVQARARLWEELLDVDDVGSLTKDRAAHPLATDAFGRSADAAARAFFAALASDPQSRYDGWLTSREVFVDGPLAKIYDLPPPTGGKLMAATLPAGRVGYLGQISFLGQHAGQTDTSPTHRGLALRRAVLCDEVPDPPPNVQQKLPSPPAGTVWSTRDRAEALLATQPCGSCHALMDRLGFALEGFDAIGKARRTDAGKPVNTTTDLDGRAVDGLPALVEALVAHPKSSACAARQLFRFATGNHEAAADAAGLEQLAARIRQGTPVAELLVELAASDLFRRPAGAP